MSEENLNTAAAGDIDTRVIIELEDGMVTNVHANRAGVEVIVVDSISERPDDGVLTAVEHNGSTVEYGIANFRPDPTTYDHSWEAAILEGIRNRTVADIVS